MSRSAWCALGALITGSTALLGGFGAYDNKAVVLACTIAYAIFGFVGITLMDSDRDKHGQKQDEV